MPNNGHPEQKCAFACTQPRERKFFYDVATLLDIARWEPDEFSRPEKPCAGRHGSACRQCRGASCERLAWPDKGWDEYTIVTLKGRSIASAERYLVPINGETHIAATIERRVTKTAIRRRNWWTARARQF
jgi:hypothetical protein